MTPNTAADPLLLPENQALSTAGITTKVLKGGLWTLVGQVFPLAIAFISTPFVIRFLGSETYGVLLLVGLIPTYFSFADFGMGIASTKFAAEAFGEGDREKERGIVWTAVWVAAVSSLVIALPMFVFSWQIVTAFHVPEHLLSGASLALKLTSMSFFIGILSAVLNSPMIARLRMDLAATTSAVPKMILAIGTPFILYFGGGLLAAVSWSLAIAIPTLAIVFYFSVRLLPELLKPTFRREFLRPLLRFGVGWILAMIAAVLIINFEKILLTGMVSVTALAYYSVAFTFANMVTMFSLALLQSLIPAFSQMLAPGKRAEFTALFGRCVRLIHFGLLPSMMLMICIARPFFTFWAGEDFGQSSTLPFYILTFGLFFSLLSAVPNCAIVAAGRSDIFAKLYWIELVIYALMAAALISWLGIVGAALAWSLRVLFDSICTVKIAEVVVRSGFDYKLHFKNVLILSALLAPAVVLAIVDSFSLILIPLTLICLSVYSVVLWNKYVDESERSWIRQRIQLLKTAVSPS